MKIDTNKGEIASLLTITSMVIISIGILVGVNINKQEAAIQPATLAAGPTPIDLGYDGGRWFEGSRGLICQANFNCVNDPQIKKLELRGTVSGGTLDLSTDVTGRSALNHVIGPACGRRGFGMQINWDPRKRYTEAQKRNIKRETGYDIKDGQILLSIRTRGGAATKYFIYDRPAWLIGNEDVIFYFEFDAKTGGVTRRYSQIALGKKGCAPEGTPTPTPSRGPSNTPTPTPSDGPTPTNTPTPSDGPTPTNTPTPSDGPTPTNTPTPSDGPTPTNTPTPSDGPTPTNTPTPTPPGPVACEFKAINYVQVCNKDAIDSNGLCERDTSTLGFKASPIDTRPLGDTWGTSNNKQIQYGRYGSKPASEFTYATGTSVAQIRDITSKFSYLLGRIPGAFTYLMVTDSFPVPAGKDPLAIGSPSDLNVKGAARLNEILFGSVASTLPEQYQKEQYYNRENAQVRLYFDVNKYRVVPEGNEINYCRNDLGRFTIGACDKSEFNDNREDLSVDRNTRDPRDTIAGLTVGCGQTIVYGWTLQECDFDLDVTFVIDTSTSMLTTTDVTTGELKKDPALRALNKFITNLKNSGGDHRAALIQYNGRPGVAGKSTRIVRTFTKDMNDVQNAVNGELTFAEGTCIECAHRQVLDLFINHRTDKSRRPVVIYLTDGLPNSDPGAPRSGGYEDEIRTEGEKIKDLHNNIPDMDPITVVGIGYGDPSKAGVSPERGLAGAELIRVIKSFTTNDSWAFSTSARVSVDEVFERIETSLNSCRIAQQAYAQFQLSKDLNGDGIINTVDLFLLYDNYFAKGAGIPEDLNEDGVVNSLDVSLIINDMGKIVSQDAGEEIN